MFKNLTMDRPATHPSLHQNMSLFSQETKARRCGNDQKLNYGSLGNAPFASPERVSVVPGDENAQVLKWSKDSLWILWRGLVSFTLRTVASSTGRISSFS